MTKNILLTGASGAVGQETLKVLLEKYPQHKLRVFDLANKSAKNVLKPYEDKVEIHLGDLRNKEDVSAATKDIDIAIHLGAVIPPLALDNTPLSEAVNVQGTANIVEGLKQNGRNPLILFSSSVAVYGDRIKTPHIKVTDPLNPNKDDCYAQQKVKAEQIIQESDIRWIIFRFSGILGTTKRKGLNPIFFHMPLDTCFEFASARDTGFLMACATNKSELEGRIFNLGGGQKMCLTYRQFLDKQFKAMGMGGNIFPEHAFAQHNFNCGYYKDSSVLNEIIPFQRDTNESHFSGIEKGYSPFKKKMMGLLKPLIAKSLLKKSAPLRAIKMRDQEELDRFFPKAVQARLLQQFHG